MTNKNHIKTSVKDPAPLNTEEFYLLTDLLFEALKGNDSLCARQLHVSRPTWKRWEQVPPVWPYWNIVLRHILKEILAQLDTKRYSLKKSHKRRILEALSRIEDESVLTTAAHLAQEYRGAESHLRRLLAVKGKYIDEVLLPANCGGYSKKSIEVASRSLGIIKTAEGFGKSKRSFWRLPDNLDD